jgi:hypothetical protein
LDLRLCIPNVTRVHRRLIGVADGLLHILDYLRVRNVRGVASGVRASLSIAKTIVVVVALTRFITRTMA